MEWMAVATATISGMVLGALWYSPVLYGDAWLRSIGKSRDELVSPVAPMLGSLLACVLAATSVEFLVVATETTTLSGGLLLGLVLGIGVVATAMLSDNMFCGWGWPLFFIQSGYRVSYLALMGAICGLWPR